MATALNLNSKRLVEVLEHAIDDWRQREFVCALSGGLDSMVMLHAMRAITPRVRALHVDHGVQQASTQWAQFCHAQSAKLDIKIEIHRLTIDATNNIEETLRDARRALFIESLKDNEVLLTAHHREDQIETFFLRLMRGAGPTGLSAISCDARNFGRGIIFRPLLRFSKDQLKAYALHHAIEWVEDPSNQHTQFDRNYWRHEVSPKLTARWPSVAKTVSRSIDLIAKADDLNRQLAQIDVQTNSNERRLNWSKIAPLDEARVANALRYWMSTLNVKPPPHNRLIEAIRQFKEAATERNPSMCWAHGCLERYRHELIFFNGSPPPAANTRLLVKSDTWCQLPNNCGRVRLASDRGDGVRQATVDMSQLSVQFRQEGQRLRRASGKHQSLKKWFQQHGIPPSDRSRLPLLMLNDEVLAIANCWVDARFRATEHQLSWRVDWNR